MIQRKPVLLFTSWGGRVTATLLGRELEHFTMTRCGKCFYSQYGHLVWALFLQRLKVFNVGLLCKPSLLFGEPFSPGENGEEMKLLCPQRTDSVNGQLMFLTIRLLRTTLAITTSLFSSNNNTTVTTTAATITNDIV